MAKPSRVAATDAEVLDRVLGIARRVDYEGYSKHDALNAPVLERLAGSSRARRLVATQLVMRSPIDVRPMVGVHKARNPKGIALFARALLARSRLLDSDTDRAEARALLDWLVDHPSPEFAPCDATARFTGLGWGYPYPWQDVGFFAPRHFPNRVVTSFAGQALLDGFETLHEPNYLDAAQRVAQFLLDAPKTLYEDVDHRCLSYVPDESVTWIVMDVSALVGAFVARLGAFCDDARLLNEGGRLVRYVVSKQTEEGAWFYAEPPSASHITHDNYHTGFILDAIQCYSLAARSDEFDKAYLRGIEFYERRLFEPGGAARFMSDRLYPIDIHGCAQGVLTFSLQQKHAGTGGEQARKVLDWTLAHMWDPRSGWFYYQKRRAFRTKIRELRWCQAWMAWALACHLECCGTAS
ncbi:MAG TPA: hypothetical protein VN636_20140 [Acidimicrobiia bacterium]|nr:hypothetical protein [Acidimicrobiia bacterium]